MSCAAPQGAWSRWVRPTFRWPPTRAASCCVRALQMINAIDHRPPAMTQAGRNPPLRRDPRTHLALTSPRLPAPPTLPHLLPPLFPPTLVLAHSPPLCATPAPRLPPRHPSLQLFPFRTSSLPAALNNQPFSPHHPTSRSHTPLPPPPAHNPGHMVRSHLLPAPAAAARSQSNNGLGKNSSPTQVNGNRQARIHAAYASLSAALVADSW